MSNKSEQKKQALKNALDVCLNVYDQLSNIIASGEFTIYDEENLEKARSFIEYYAREIKQ